MLNSSEAFTQASIVHKYMLCLKPEEDQLLAKKI